MYSADVMPPSSSAALHQPNHGAARFFSQNTANSAPSTSLINSPNSRTVKESIGMVECGGAFANRRQCNRQNAGPLLL